MYYDLQKSKLEVLASDPTPWLGRLYFNSTTKEVRIYDGSVWKTYQELKIDPALNPADGDLLQWNATSGFFEAVDLSGSNHSHANKVILDAILSTPATLDGVETLTNKTLVAINNIITTAAAGNLTSTELNAALNELQLDIDSRQSVTTYLTALLGTSNGILVKTGANTAAARTITGTANRIVVADGDGVAGNPTLDIGSDVLTKTGAAVVTNKDIDGGAASNSNRITIPYNTKSNLDSLTRKTGTVVHCTDEHKFYGDDGNILRPFDSRTGEKNYVKSPDDSYNDWNSSGSVSVTLETNTANMPELSKGTAIKLTSTGSGYGYTRFRLDSVELSKQLRIVGRLKTSDAAGDWTVEVWTYSANDYVTGQVQITPTTTSIPTGQNYFQTTFLANTNQYVEIRFKAAVTGKTLWLSGVGCNTVEVNKTLQTPIIDDYLAFNEESTPSTPSAGKLLAYAKSDHKLYTKDSNGVETQVGAGSAGGVTFFYDDFENGSTSNWATYKDAAQATPVDGTGGSPTVISVSASSSSPLRGTYSLAIAKSAANGQGEGVAAAFSIPSGYQIGAKRRIAFLWDGSGANYVAGDMTCYVYDVTNSTLITPSVTSLPAAKVPVELSWDSTTSGSYRLIFHCASTNASAYTVKVDDVTVDPGKIVPGYPGGHYETVSSYTIAATTSNPTPGSGTTYLRTTYRDGEWAIIRYEFKMPNTGSAGSGDYLLPLPTGLTINYAKAGAVGTGNATGVVGTGQHYHNASTYYDATGHIVNSGPYVNKIYVGLTNATQAFTVWASGFNSLASVQELALTVRVPITEWASPTYMGANDVEYAYNYSTTTSDDLTSFGYGPQGASIVAFTGSTHTKRIKFQTPIQSTDLLTIEINPGGAGSTWLPVIANNAGGLAYVQQNTTTYGIWLSNQSDTEINVVFGSYAIPTGASFGSAGTAWSSISTYKWRVRKVTGGAAVGFGYATATQSGLVKNGGAPTSLAYTDLTSQTNCVIGAGDVQHFKWKITDNVVTIWFGLDAITVTGGVASFSFVLPASVPRPSGSYVYGSAAFYDNTSSSSVSALTLMRSSTGSLEIYKQGGGTWTGGTNTCYLAGQMSWPID